MIVQRLHQIQEKDGYLTHDAMVELASELGVRLSELHEVASFYPHYRLSKPPVAEVRVCRDMSCHLKGAVALTAELKRRLASGAGSQINVGAVSCLGQCDRAPAVRVNDRECSLQDPEEITRLVTDLTTGKRNRSDIPAYEDAREPRDWFIDPYKGQATYSILRQFNKTIDAAAILKTLEDSGLVGLGGPGSRTYKKWTEVKDQQAKMKFVVCNGDESEPGTFKDRELLVHAPHLIVEGMILGGLVVGAEQGYVYIRHEYEKPIAAMRAAIAEAYKEKVLGRPSEVTGKNFDLEVFVSPGGYICGEQTALIEAMEDHRSEPRNRPPDLEVKGFRGQPTLLNNIETFAWVPSILNDDAKSYRDQGANGGRGRRFFSISGDVGRPGVYEVPVGTTVGELIELAGGLPRGLKALATSGPSGGFLPKKLPVLMLKKGFRADLLKKNRSLATKVAEGALELDILDLELDVQVFRILDAQTFFPGTSVPDYPKDKVSIMLGAGIVVFGEGQDMVDHALNCSRFFRDESCGKCVPCREGTQRIVQIAERLNLHRGDANALETEGNVAAELRSAMCQASICGLGQVAANPLLTTINFFPLDFTSNDSATAEEPRANG